MPRVRLQHGPFFQRTEPVSEQFKNRLDVALTGVLGDRQIGHNHVVEVAPAQIVDVLAERRELKAEEALAGAEIA